jgi:ribosomal-protein-alanine N-acetyltransferase
MTQGQKVRLRPKRLGDLVNDYAWRCDQELAHFDARPPLAVPFNDFLASYIQELNPSAESCRFAIETPEGKQIGNCMYFNLDHKIGQVEIGIMIGDRTYWNQGYGADAVNALVDYIFNSITVTKVCLHTLNWNLRAQHCFAKCGFYPSGFLLRDGYSFIRMEITRSRWETRLKSKGS